ncbi:hypothetical protein F2Q70_00020388 [Brassica cretica]|uniref:Uncharacterized protein n=1 Tax=Brassica cretica TaxID=69181 RepID=A0A8S9GLJ6_BRACR|nr:hypothetical protein F2Q70_00020388 [Brassica cretica]
MRGVDYHVDARYTEMEKDKVRVYVLTAGHLSYWCDPEGEDVHDCSMQKTIMLKDGRYGHWKVRMKLLVRGINDVVWIAVKIGWKEHTIFTAEGKKLKPKEPR